MKPILNPLGWLFLLILCFSPEFIRSAQLATATSSLFSASGNCVFCHDQWGGALTDKSGQSVSITEDWRGTMMAHAFKDPLWRAVMEAETQLNPGLKSFIEDKCQTCHAPLARTQHCKDLGVPYPYAAGKTSELAADGVSCTLCHQIQPDHLGHIKSFSGQYEIRSDRQVFGPYKDVITMPMQHHVDYTPQFGEHMHNSGLCATCHTLFTPILGEKNQIVGQFPEQVPYLEWKASNYARTGQHCQDCHMQRLEEPIKVSARPPWLEPREPFWRHQFVGGNTFMLQLLGNHEKALKPQAGKERLQTTLAKAREQLRRAAQLKVNGRRDGKLLELHVEVKNHSGHKFPTGHPYRRAWLHVLVTDPEGAVLFESGRTDSAGRLRWDSGDYAIHLDKITRPGQVQVYESVMGNKEGNRTYGLLEAVSYLKDNRIPPQGFEPGKEMSDIAIRGKARGDENFNYGSGGSDRVTYEIELGKQPGPVTATVELLYQSVPPEAVARLLTSKGKEAGKFAKYYKTADKKPETVQTTTVHY